MRQYIPWFLTFVAAPLVGYLVYWMKAKTDVWRLSRQADITAIQTPFKVLQDALAKRDAENAEMRKELHLIVTNHLAHDAEDRTAVVRALTQLTSTVAEMGRTAVEDRTASAEQRKSIHERLNQIQLQIASKP
jgi:hypothetical protein